MAAVQNSPKANVTISKLDQMSIITNANSIQRKSALDAIEEGNSQSKEGKDEE
jgi:hypothetical protein